MSRKLRKGTIVLYERAEGDFQEDRITRRGRVSIREAVPTAVKAKYGKQAELVEYKKEDTKNSWDAERGPLKATYYSVVYTFPAK